MNLPPRARHVIAVALTVFAIGFLHLALSLFYWLPDPRLGAALAPTAEALALFGLLLLAAFGADIAGAKLWRSPRAQKIAGHGVVKAAGSAWRWARRRVGARTCLATLTLAVFVLFLLGFGQGFARREFGYDLVLILHLPYVPDLFQMMYWQEPLWRFVLFCALLALVVAGVWAASYFSIRRIYRYAAHTRTRRVAIACALAIYAGTVGLASHIHTGLAGEVEEQIDLAMNLEEKLDTTAREMEIESAKLQRQSPFSSLDQKPSILIIVVESYGEVVFSDSEYRATMPAFIGRLGDKLTAAGYHIRSRYLTSPVFGGSSWMAASTILCGIKIENQKRFASLHHSGVACLPAILGDTDYRTVLLAPNTTYTTDSARRLFGYDERYIKGRLGYQGPRFAWSYMPDQYALRVLHERELKTQRTRPLFVYAHLTSSHHAWKEIPTYVGDWNGLGNGSVYKDIRSLRFNNRFVTGSEYKPAYKAAIQYSMTTVAGLLELLPATDDSLIVILGDHQPRRPIADMNEDTWWVPVHILSHDKTAVDRFETLGYAPGMIPAASDTSPPGLSQLIRHLFDAYAQR